jgi:hypothetical protein
MEAEVPPPHLPTEGAHYFLPILKRPFHELTFLPAPVPLPENPKLALIPVPITPEGHSVEGAGHRYLPGSQGATPFLSGIEHHISPFKVYIFPDRPVDFAHPAHVFFDAYQIVLGVWVRGQQDSGHVLLGWYILDFPLHRYGLYTLGGVLLDKIIFDPEIEKCLDGEQFLVGSESRKTCLVEQYSCTMDLVIFAQLSLCPFLHQPLTYALIFRVRGKKTRPETLRAGNN